MNLIEGINNTIVNTKGSKYYNTSYNYNLDLFCSVSRYDNEDKIITNFNNALSENETLALANLLYILDIRNGKGERRIFKIIFKYLCKNKPLYAIKILPFISELGRYDYILEGINTNIHNEVISLIKNQLLIDINSDNPSLLAKWLPSHRTHNSNNKIAKIIMKELNMNEKEYRKTLSKIRTVINIVEKNLTEKKYKNIDFNKVPSKAMLKYNNVFLKNMKDEFEKYKEEVKKGNSKINTEGLFAYEIIKKVLSNSDDSLCDIMWNKQKDVLNGCNSNVLVMADTSGSMTCFNSIPFYTSIGLALYTAERNNGFFKNHFLTFSSEPQLYEVKGNTLKEKVLNIKPYVDNTDIDKAFELILNTAIENNLEQKELPSHLLIISDMEFDRGVYSKEGTNFKGWKKSFLENGYNLPNIIFWNVAGSTKGLPVTVFDNDVSMISGFSTNILNNLLTLENYSPLELMYDKLNTYIELLNR